MIIPNTGDLPGVWGSNAVNPDFASIDGFVGGIQTVSVSNANVSLTAPAGSITPTGGPTQAQNAVLRFTGTLTASVQVTLPLPGYMIIENLTTGAFVLSFRAIGSGQVIGVAQGVVRHIYNDGTNVRFVNLPDPGSYWDLAASSIPAWIAACTVPPWLNCDGTTFNGTTYPYLASLLGGTTLPDFRGVAAAYLNQGTGRITTAGSGIDGNTLLSTGGGQTETLTAVQIPTITVNGVITVNSTQIDVVQDSGGTTLANNGATGSGPPKLLTSNGAVGGIQSSGNNTLTSNNTGGQPHPIMGPTTIAGIRLIRAA